MCYCSASEASTLCFVSFSKRAPVLVGAACYYSRATIRLAQVLVCTRFQGNSCRPCALDENDDRFDDDGDGDDGFEDDGDDGFDDDGGDQIPREFLQTLCP